MKGWSLVSTTVSTVGLTPSLGGSTAVSTVVSLKYSSQHFFSISKVFSVAASIAGAAALALAMPRACHKSPLEKKRVLCPQKAASRTVTKATRVPTLLASLMCAPTTLAKTSESRDGALCCLLVCLS